MIQFACNNLDDSQKEWGNFFNLLQEKRGTQKDEGSLKKTEEGGGVQLWRKLSIICNLLHFCVVGLHKSWSFPSRLSLVNVTKPAVFCWFGHIYWTNLSWRFSFFCCVLLISSIPIQQFLIWLLVGIRFMLVCFWLFFLKLFLKPHF